MTTDGPVHHKYNVSRVDRAELDPASKHHGGCDLFVLDLSHDPAALPALRAYIDAVRPTHPILAGSLTVWGNGIAADFWRHEPPKETP